MVRKQSRGRRQNHRTPSVNKVFDSGGVKEIRRRPVNRRVAKQLDASGGEVGHVVRDSFVNGPFETKDLQYQLFDDEGKRISPSYGGILTCCPAFRRENLLSAK